MAISFLSIMNAPRLSVLEMQRQIAEAQVETSTGRHADQGLALGGRTSEAVSLRNQFDRNAALIDMNGLTKAELDAVQSTLGSIAALAHDFTATLIGARNAQNGQQAVKAAAEAALASFTALINTTHNGEAVFGGINTGVAPLGGYAGSPAKAAVDAAFLAEFGFPQSSPAAGTITSAQMDAFLTGNFDALFTPANWQGTWSQASSQNRATRVDHDFVLESSANANEQAFRELAGALTSALDLGAGQLSQSAFEKIVDRASAGAALAAQELGDIQGRLGRVQQTVSQTKEKLEQRNNIINREILSLEGVDAYEAATRVNTLTSQLEASYAITARIGRLSLLNFL
jgi:flagellar hook-associated protein 3 FlgL